MQKRLASLMKWAGGKEQELKHILPLLPAFHRYYEPFVGGGAVFFSIDVPEKFINDRSSELVRFYTMVAEQNQDFLHTLDLLVHGWQQISSLADTHVTELSTLYTAFADERLERKELEHHLLQFLHDHQHEFYAMVAPLCPNDCANFLTELRRNLFSKTRRMKTLELRKGPMPASDICANLECALKSGFYMYLRQLYNSLEEKQISAGAASAIFFFVRENAYAAMFRYNSQGKFNVPYGGITYNRKDLARKIAFLRSPELLAHLRGTVIANLDFEVFLNCYPPQQNDFLFLDPPYDSDFSTYTRNEFTLHDQKRLATYLLTRCPAKFLLVIKNTPFIQSLYAERGLSIQSFEKKYLVSFQARNNREAEHLIIKNY